MNTVTPIYYLRRGGFSFIEILFAIILLGIGFIMVSAVFPVGVAQTQSMIQRTTGDAIAKNGAKIFEAGVHWSVSGLGVTAALATDNQVHFDAPPSTNFQYIWLDRISTSDNRYGWVPFYRCTSAAGVIPPRYQVYVIATECQNASTYNTSSGGAAPYESDYLANDLTPQLVTATLEKGTSGSPDLILFASMSNLRAASGCYVIVQNHTNPQCNGMVVHVGAPRPDIIVGSTGYIGPGTYFELVPGEDAEGKSPDPSGVACSAYIVGQGWNDPTNATPATNFPTGKAQDISIYPLPGSANAGAAVTLNP